MSRLTELFTWTALSLRSKAILTISAICALALPVVGFSVLLNTLTPITTSPHAYATERLSGGDWSLLYDVDYMRTHLQEPNAVWFALLDLAYPIIYGLAALIAFRTVLVGLPQHVYWPDWRGKCFFVPLIAAMITDWFENGCILFLSQSRGGGEIPPEIVKIMAFASALKTFALLATGAALVIYAATLWFSGKRSIESDCAPPNPAAT